MFRSITLARPDDVVLVSRDELSDIVPYSYAISVFRHRTFDNRRVYYQPPVYDVRPALADTTVPKAPSRSYIEMLYPFSTNATLRGQYRRFETNEIRYGLMLEDIDSFAGDVAKRHAGPDIHAVVTGFVDKISWLHHGALGALAVDRDLRMAGQVTWVGRSSMEVLMQVSSLDPGPPPTWNVLGTARFVMVARDGDLQHSLPVPPLAPTNDAERSLFHLGGMHQEARRSRQEHSLAQKPPTADEVALMHNLVRSGASWEAQQRRAVAPAGAAPGVGSMSSMDTGAEEEDGPVAEQAAPGGAPHSLPKAVCMRHTQQSHTCLMHLQDRNNHHRIFGGHLLRLAFELAYATASMHAGQYCPPLSMEDIAFFHPVPIGCIVQFRSKVVYTEGPVLRVHVKAVKVEPGSSATTLTNTFSIAFLHPGGACPRVMPESFQEYLEYLEGHRQQRADQLEQTSYDAMLGKL